MLNELTDDLLVPLLSSLSSYERAVACQVCKRWVPLLQEITCQLALGDDIINSYHLMCMTKQPWAIIPWNRIIQSRDPDVFRVICWINRSKETRLISTKWKDYVYKYGSFEQLEILIRDIFQSQWTFIVKLGIICQERNTRALNDCIFSPTADYAELMRFICKFANRQVWHLELLETLSTLNDYQACLHCGKIH